MQTPVNTERYMVACRGSKMAIRFNELRIFDCMSDAVEYAASLKGYSRIFVVSNDKRAKEVKDWEA